MRSKNSGLVNPSASHPGTLPYQQPEKSSKQICRLENSHCYFLECVYIIAEPGSYRLVVLHNNRLLFDRAYPTMKGARISFSRRYLAKAWEKGIENHWSYLYFPEREWLENQTTINEEVKKWK